MADNPVHFGTDGWRALLADTFTFENVRACAAATADYFAAAQGTGKPFVVGFDTRFLSEDFAEAVARVVAKRGFDVFLADRPAPTPAISYDIVRRGAAGGIVVTSSHNPFNWNGIKVKPHYGGSASPEIVEDIEARVPTILASGPAPHAHARGRIERFDPLPRYIEGLEAQVDVQRIRDAGLKVAIDSMYGAGAGILRGMIEGGSTTVTELHGERNPAFPGIKAPEPIESNLGALMDAVAHGGFDIGLANDGDADRAGLVDEHGRYVNQLRTFALLVNYLLGERGLKGAVVRSLTTTTMADILAVHYGVECRVTPVGFKHIGPLMMELDALIGGEESGGYGFRGHLPERDGILTDLFLLDYLAATGRKPSQLMDDVFAIAGEHFYAREDFELPVADKPAMMERIDAARPTDLAGLAVTQRDTLDGWRFVTDEGWLLFRMSGTEPLLRIYTEVRSEALVAPLIAAGRALAGV